ncbi:MAG: GDSL-type esterase/lipase family protein [Candidatus Thiodiazotropha sp.]
MAAEIQDHADSNLTMAAESESHTNSSGLTISSAGSSIILSDSHELQDEFLGFAQADSNVEISDPLDGIFYHLMPSQDSTNILFYNKPLYNNILTVLSKEFQFPAEEAKSFTIKTHVDRKRCSLFIDKKMMSICASGPGHVFWKEHNFKKLTEYMYRKFVQETNSVLNRSTSVDNQNSLRLSESQVSTQINQSGSSNLTTTEAEVEPPAVPTTEQSVDSTSQQDTPVIRQISALMDMVHSLQGQISTLTTQINQLVEQAANDTIYRTVDQTNSVDWSQSLENDHYTEHNSATNIEDELSQENNAIERADSQGCTNPINIEDLPTPNVQLPDLQPHLYSEVVRTSTPRNSTQQTPQRRPRPAPRQRQRTSEVPQSVQPSPQNDQKEVLLIGDSLISSINSKGLTQNVFRNGIPGATIREVSNQIKVFDLKKFSHVVIYIGGNDASSGSDPEFFEEIYDQVIQHIKLVNRNCRIILCNICPRGDTSTADMNEVIKQLSQHHDTTLIDMDRAFHDSHGKIIERYFVADCIHLSSSGIKRLLGAISKEIQIVKDFEHCVFPSRYQRKTRSSHHQVNNRRSKSYRSRPVRVHTHQNEDEHYCYKCGENNHETAQCRHSEQLKCFHCNYYGHKSYRCLNK